MPVEDIRNIFFYLLQTHLDTENYLVEQTFRDRLIICKISIVSANNFVFFNFFYAYIVFNL